MFNTSSCRYVKTCPKPGLNFASVLYQGGSKILHGSKHTYNLFNSSGPLLCFISAFRPLLKL